MIQIGVGSGLREGTEWRCLVCFQVWEGVGLVASLTSFRPVLLPTCRCFLGLMHSCRVRLGQRCLFVFTPFLREKTLSNFFFFLLLQRGVL